MDSNKLEWALTPQGREALKLLMEAGVDKDLAFEMLNKMVKDRELYSLDDGDDAA